MTEFIPNVLAARYASRAARGAVVAGTQDRPRTPALARGAAGTTSSSASTCPTARSTAYEAVIDKVDLASIEARERVTRHDVKARIEEFSALAGHEQIHKGMTSRDLTENVEQLQVRASLELLRDRMVAAIARLGAAGGRSTPSASSSAGPTTSPRRRRRLASASPPRAKSCCSRSSDSRICSSAIRCAASRARWERRRISSTCSTVTCDKLAQLEEAVARHLGFDRVLDSVGQVYPRSLDLDVVVRARAGGSRAVVTGDDDPAHGRARAA